MKPQKKKRTIPAPPDTATLLVSMSDTTPIAVSDLPEPLWTPRLLLALALLSGIGLMIPAMTAGALALDEYGTYWLVNPNNPGTLWQRSLDYENIPPLSPYLQRQLVWLCGPSEFSLRLLSMLSYWLAIPAVYLLGRELLGRMGAGLASVVLAWHPGALGEIRIARCYSLTLLLATLAFWVTVRWSRKPLSAWLIPWTLLNVALVWTHYLNAGIVAVEAVWLLWSFRRSSLHVWTLFAIGFGTVVWSALPLVAPFIRIASWGDAFNYQSSTPIWRTIIPVWWLGLPVGWITGWWWSRGSHRPWLPVPTPAALCLLFAWGLLPAILAATVCHGDLASLANPRYRIGFVAPSACLLVACLSVRRTAFAAFLGVCVALVLGWSAAPRLPWELKRIGNERDAEWKAMALDIDARGTAGEPIFVQSGLGEGFVVPVYYDDLIFQDYIGCRIGRLYLQTPHPRYGLPFLWNRSDGMVEFYRDLVRQRAEEKPSTLWVAAATDTDLNVASLKGFQMLLAEGDYREIDRRETSTSVLIRYAHEPRP